MKLLYELSNGHTLESPDLTEDERKELVNTYIGFADISGGYLFDKVNIIDIDSIVAISIK